MAIHFKGRLDRDLYLRAARSDMATKSTLLGAVVALVFGALLQPFVPSLGWILLALGALIVVLRVIVELQLRKSWRTDKLGPEPFRGTLSEEGFELVTDHGSSSVSWDRFYQWKATESELLVFTSDATFHILARSFFAGDEDWTAARELVAAKVPSKRRVERRGTVWNTVVLIVLWIAAFVTVVLLWQAYEG